MPPTDLGDKNDQYNRPGTDCFLVYSLFREDAGACVNVGQLLCSVLVEFGDDLAAEDR